MSRAAKCVMSENRDIVIAYGESDEDSFVFRKDTTSYHRRARYENVLFLSAYCYLVRVKIVVC